jgi:hypothetical protein
MPRERFVQLRLNESTVKRLRRRKAKGQTDDQVINAVLDALPLERVPPEVLREHKRAMKAGRWTPLDEIRKSLGDE